MSDTVQNAVATHATDADFAEQVEKAAGVVLVDFGAEWCGPCRMMDPVMEQVARDYAGRVKVVKVDTDANLKLSTRFNVRSLPTFMLFRDGQVVDTLIGAVPPPALRRRLDEML